MQNATKPKEKREMDDHKTRVGRPWQVRRALLRSFHVLSITLLALLLPLSLLLVARIASSSFPFIPYSSDGVFLLIASFFFHSVVLLVAVLSFLHVCTGYLPNPDVHLAWVVLSILQVSVGLGIEGTMGVDMPKSTAFVSIGVGSWVHRLVFFMGVYETTVFWSRAFVKRVVDDTIYGTAMEERGAERVAVGVMFGFVWLGILREEVEGLAFMNREGWHGLANWSLSRLMVFIGAARVLKWIVIVARRQIQLLFQIEAEKGGICRFCEESETEQV